MAETVIEAGERGTLMIPYGKAGGEATHFTVTTMNAEALIVTVFDGPSGEAAAGHFRRWLERPQTWQAFRDWAQGEDTGDDPELHISRRRAIAGHRLAGRRARAHPLLGPGGHRLAGVPVTASDLDWEEYAEACELHDAADPVLFLAPELARAVSGR